MKLFDSITENTGEIRISKPVVSLFIASSATLAELETATISAYIEKSNGNTNLLVEFPLTKFLLMQTFANPALCPFLPTASLTSGICELSSQGAIFLNENESIKLKIENHATGEKLTIYGIEDPIPSNQMYFFERKVALAEEQTRKFNVINNDVLAIDNFDVLKDVIFTYANGTSNKFDSLELVALSLDIDPLTLTLANGTVSNLGNNATLPILLPLSGVESIEFNKTVGESLPIYLRSEIINN